jgi:hypothetical protein
VRHRRALRRTIQEVAEGGALALTKADIEALFGPR